ncbi:hemerythrin domain-containing protein [Nakamurella sp.]|uniref:hemerythrin domain-containing protein n=1 Tax=Nakamurella sp. TaxID=1869182 RepID=UPI003785068B
MTTTLPPVPQISFAGQAAAPPGPCDLVAMYVMHHAFRRDLRVFGAAVAATPVGDRRTWQALRGRWRRFSRVLHHHHSGEDEALWPLLLSRASTDGDRAALRAMADEHEEIDPLLAGCAAGFERLASGPDEDERAALAVRLAATAERLGRHLGHEETDAMAVLQAHLTPSEWDHLHPAFARHYSVGDMVFTVSWVLDGLPADQRRTVLRFFGIPLTATWHVLRWPHHWRERRIFRYVRPAVGG